MNELEPQRTGLELASVEAQIAQWRSFAARRAEFGADLDELEDHLRTQIDELTRAGLSADEAVLVAVRRLGRLDDLSREFAREHSDRLWKQLVIGSGAAPGRSSGLATAVALAAGAALAIKLPVLLFGSPSGTTEGVHLLGASAVEATARNAGLLVLPFLAALFLIRRRASRRTVALVAAWFAVIATTVNLPTFNPPGMTAGLVALHTPAALWGAVGLAYTGGLWRSAQARMDAIRFTGEWVVYLALIALGGGVLCGLTYGAFAATGRDVGWLVEGWLVPCGAAGAAVVAGWLVEAKQNVIENIAPVLTKVFTPLFTALLVGLVAAGLLQGDLTASRRDLLIIFDLVLVVVFGLLLYALSAREATARAGWFDRLQLLLVVSAIVVDAFVLIAMVGRINEFGASANKVASLGLNLILLLNLLVAAWLLARFTSGRSTLAASLRWQTGYLPTFAAWALLVIAVLPPVFGYR